jgi:DNA-binding SARP family transcriptional activator
MALLCLLIVHPRMTATRDQVLDALWPSSDPTTALNSLNQTIYFLRRVIEPSYAAGSSPEYIHFEGEAIWLDSDLVSSRSHDCRTLMNEAVGRESEAIDQILDNYTDRFALDFAYEDWAAHYRDSLHASFLATVERAIGVMEDAGQYEAAVLRARRALQVDPSADEVELRLLRLYRRTHAHAAAAEQYAHYASVLRDELGVEPPRLEEI